MSSWSNDRKLNKFRKIFTYTKSPYLSRLFVVSSPHKRQWYFLYLLLLFNVLFWSLYKDIVMPSIMTTITYWIKALKIFSCVPCFFAHELYLVAIIPYSFLSNVTYRLIITFFVFRLCSLYAFEFLQYPMSNTSCSDSANRSFLWFYSLVLSSKPGQWSSKYRELF